MVDGERRLGVGTRGRRVLRHHQLGLTLAFWLAPNSFTEYIVLGMCDLTGATGCSHEELVRLSRNRRADSSFLCASTHASISHPGVPLLVPGQSQISLRFPKALWSGWSSKSRADAVLHAAFPVSPGARYGWRSDRHPHHWPGNSLHVSCALEVLHAVSRYLALLRSHDRPRADAA